MAKVQQVIDHIREGRYDRAFTRLYAADTAALEKQKARYIQALEQFALYYGADREVTLYSAPGRTEIGGPYRPQPRRGAGRRGESGRDCGGE